VLSVVNPAVRLPREVLNRYVARGSVRAELGTRFQSLRGPVVRQLEEVWNTAKPQYIGPAGNRFANSIKDFADNPEFYSGVTPELRAAALAYDDVSTQLLRQARQEYGVDILKVIVEAPADSCKLYPPLRAALIRIDWVGCPTQR